MPRGDPPAWISTGRPCGEGGVFSGPSTLKKRPAWVIVSTSASLPPGAALPRPPRASDFATLAGPAAGPAPRLLPWTLLTVPTA